ncbi:MAG: hypothetical protein ACOC9W_05575, partial [Persicimonas sp.]
MAVARVHPERATLLLDRVTRNFDASEEGPAEEVSKMAEEFEDIGEQLVLGLMDPDANLKVDTSEEEPGLDGLDAERSIVMAFSTQGNEAAIEHFLYASPLLNFATRPAFGTRLFIPASDPGALRDSLAEECEAEDACSRLRRVESVGDWVVADLSKSDIDGLEPSPDAESSSFFERATPAANAFWGSDSAAGFYVRGDGLEDIIWLKEAASIARAMPQASPEHRWLMLMHSLGQISASEVLDPEAREKEDLSVVLSTREDATAIVDSYTTYTEKGAAVAERAKREASLPSTDVETPTVEFEYAVDSGAAIDEATAPGWMLDEPTEDRRGDDFQYEDELVMLMTAMSTFGTLHGFGEGSDAPEEVDALAEHFEGLLAARGAIRIDDPKAAPTGAVAILVERDSPADARIGAVIEQFEARVAERTDGELSSHVDERDVDERHYRIGLGVDESAFGSEAPVADTISVQGDAVELAELTQATSGGYVSMGHRLFHAVLSTITRLDLHHKMGSRGGATRLTIDGDEPGRAELPESSVELQQPSGLSACQRDLHRTATMLFNEEREAAIFAENIARLDDELASLEDQCGELSRTIGRTRANWHLLAAYIAADAYVYGTAHELSERACKIGQEDACEISDRFATLADQVVLPAAHPTVGLASYPSHKVHLAPDGAYRISAVDFVDRDAKKEELSDSVDDWTE